jgi:hypothetical protein
MILFASSFSIWRNGNMFNVISRLLVKRRLAVLHYEDRLILQIGAIDAFERFADQPLIRTTYVGIELLHAFALRRVAVPSTIFS